MVRPQQSSIVVPKTSTRRESRRKTQTRSAFSQRKRFHSPERASYSQPFGEPSELGAHLPYRAARLQRLKFRQRRDALFQCARETGEDFGPVENGGARPHAGLEGSMGIDDRALDVVGICCVDTVRGCKPVPRATTYTIL